MGNLHPPYLDDMSPTAWLLSLTALPLALFFLKRVLYPTYDSREPPALWPKIPFIGHVISIAWESGGYYERIFKHNFVPICTLPVLHGKLYVINSASLISAAQRSQTLSFYPFVELFSQNALGLSKREVERFSEPGYIAAASKPIHPSLMGEPLRDLVFAGLTKIAAEFNAIGAGGGLKDRDVIGWLREVLSQAVMVAVYGEEKNPMTPEVHSNVWDFDKQAHILVVGVAPRWLAPKAIAARDRLHAALQEFYVARLDEDPSVSVYVQKRAAVKRQLGVKDEDLAGCEFDIPWTAVTNTVPSMIWFFQHVFSRSDYVERVRAEVLEVTAIHGNKATIDATKLDKKPFISACFQEILRLYTSAWGNRRVMEDTTLRDVDGREYLLKKDTNVQWFNGIPHLHEAVWGDDSHTFNPERFINVPSHEEKKRRGALIPFGGGKHLCPGRLFAMTETISMVGALALAFDIEGAKVPTAGTPYAANTVRRPIWGPGEPGRVSVKRRKGWEEVELSFVV